MAIPLAAIGAGAAIVAGAILKFESENALQNGPEYVRDGDPTGIVPSVGLAIARQACRRYADGESSLLADVEVGFETVCRPYLDNIGYGTGPKLLKPFDGGQCEGVVYRLEGQLKADLLLCNSGEVVPGLDQFVSTELIFIGPIVSITPRYFGSVSCGPNQFVMVVVHDGGAQTTETFFQVNPSNSWQNAVFTGGAKDATGVGGPCGSPPPDVIDPVPPPTPGPDTEPYNPNPDIDIDITVNLRPDSLIEVNLGFGPFVIPIFGGGDDQGGGGGPDPDTSPPAPEPGPENPGGNGGFGGDDMFGEPPAGRRWVGCCIRITQTPSNASVIATSEPEDVYPGVIGNVRLVCNAAGNRFADTPVRILAKHVCVWEPVQKLNPVGVSVDLLPGYGYTFRPYSVPSGD